MEKITAFRNLVELRNEGAISDDTLLKGLNNILDKIDWQDSPIVKEYRKKRGKYKHRKLNNYKMWTKDDDNYLLENKDKKTKGKMAKGLGRTKHAVANRLWALTHKQSRVGLSKVKYNWKPWTQADKEYLAHQYPKIKVDLIAKSLGRSTETCYVMARKLKVSKWKKGKSETVQVGENKYPRKYSQMG